MSGANAYQTSSNIPKHVAVIMDGNGRWAQQKGNHRIFGHQNAIKAVRDTVEAAAEIGVECLTLYAFSTENWNRPKLEVDALMHLLVEALSNELPTLKKNNIKLISIGDKTRLPASCINTLNTVMEATRHNTHMTLNIALSYSGRWDIVEAAKNLSKQVQQGLIQVEDINETLFSNALSTHNLPDPELLIRTSGEYRLSNFLLWECSYTEFIFTEILWPDFRKEDFYKAIEQYQQRERRFGKTTAHA
jgi:undecaprenyl diphosphate synthase